MPLVATWILFAHSARSATVHGAPTHDRMTSSSSVSIGPSPLDGMIEDSINATAAPTSFSGFGALDRAQLQWRRRAVRGNVSVLLASISICIRTMSMSVTELTGFDKRVSAGFQSNPRSVESLVTPRITPYVYTVYS